MTKRKILELVRAYFTIAAPKVRDQVLAMAMAMAMAMAKALGGS